MLNRRAMTMLALMLVLSNGAFAGGAVGGAAKEIADINEEIAVLSAKLAEIEVRAKIATKEQEIKRIGAPSGASGADSKDLPVVRSIEGVDGRLLATIATGGGSTQTVVKGDKIGEWTVSKIDVNAVTLNRRKETVRLGFGAEPPVSPSSSSAQGGIPSPGFPR